MQFILASTNAHKAQEFAELMGDAPFKIVPAPSGLEVVEDGTTFEQNAYKKAMAYYREHKIPALADDSGLVLPAFPEILGIQSARFAPEVPDYKGKNTKLLQMLKGGSEWDRLAYFVCVLCFVLSEDEVFFFEGRVHGRIGTEIKGEKGFGYDPIFEPDGLNGYSMAQDEAWKNQNSHRAKACREAVNFFKGKISIAKMDQIT